MGYGSTTASNNAASARYYQIALNGCWQHMVQMHRAVASALPVNVVRAASWVQGFKHAA